MPIQFRSGLPGAGKTLGAVEHIMKLQKDEGHRPRFVLGITDLRDDLATVITEEQLKDWQSFPAGSIIIVDECQKYMPSRRTGDPPKWIRDLSTHRHLGLDFILISQHPSLIDTYVRRLVDCHIHTVRRWGTTWVDRWQWSECQGDPTTPAARKAADSRIVTKYSKAAMGAYTSAELHTVKRRVPPYVFYGLAALVAFPILLWLVFRILHGIGGEEPSKVSGPASSSSAAQTHVAQGKDHVMTKDEWVARFTPRVAGMPWSAPAYDDQQVQGTPEVYCASMEHDATHTTCSCITEQGTKAAVPFGMCMEMARNGTYNPYRKARPEQMPMGASVAQASAPVDSRPLPEVPKLVVGGGVGGPLRTGYVPPDSTRVGAISAAGN